MVKKAAVPKPKASRAKPPSRMRALERFLDTNGWRVVVTRGKPADAQTVAHWERLLELSFPPDYVEFLTTYGALRLRTASAIANRILLDSGGFDGPTDPDEDLTVLGHATDDNELSLSDGRVAFAKDGQRAPKSFVPVIVRVGYWGDVWGIGADSAFLRYSRGAMNPAEGTFSETLEASLASLSQRLDELYSDESKARWQEMLSG